MSLVSADVPARPGFIHILRSVVASVAARFDVPVDSVAELRIVVDEMCSELLSRLDAVTRLEMDVEVLPGTIEIVVTASGASGKWPQDGVREGLRWQILTALADDIQLVTRRDNPAIRAIRRVVGPTTGESSNQ